MLNLYSTHILFVFSSLALVVFAISLLPHAKSGFLLTFCLLGLLEVVFLFVAKQNATALLSFLATLSIAFLLGLTTNFAPQIKHFRFKATSVLLTLLILVCSTVLLIYPKVKGTKMSLVESLQGYDVEFFMVVVIVMSALLARKAFND